VGPNSIHFPLPRPLVEPLAIPLALGIPPLPRPLAVVPPLCPIVLLVLDAGPGVENLLELFVDMGGFSTNEVSVVLTRISL
jgi:hypothetical protein